MQNVKEMQKFLQLYGNTLIIFIPLSIQQNHYIMFNRVGNRFIAFTESTGSLLLTCTYKVMGTTTRKAQKLVWKASEFPWLVLYVSS